MAISLVVVILASFGCDGANFTGTIDTTALTEVAYSFTAIMSDPAGNETTSSAVTITKDITPPNISLVVPANASVVKQSDDSSTFTVSGSCSESAQTVTIEVNENAGGYNPATSPLGLVCNGVNFSGSIDSTAIAEGIQ